MITTVSAQAEHIPANWDDMELCKWYDLIQGGPYLHNFQCDPGIPGRMYGLAEEQFQGDRYPTISYDYGRTWSENTGKIETQYGSLEKLRNQVIWFGSNNQRIFWLVATIEVDDDYSVFLLKRYDFCEPWQIVANCSIEFNLDTDHDITNISIGHDGKIFIQERGVVWVSSDLGESWRKTFSPGIRYPNNYLEFSPIDQNVVYITTNYHADSLLWKSVDYGETWSPLNISTETPGVGHEGLVGIQCHPLDPDILFVFISNIYNPQYKFGTKMSSDGGLTWVDYGPEFAYKCSDIYINPRDTNQIILACTLAPNIVRSDDGGATWEARLYTEKNNFYLDDLFESPWNSSILYFSTSGVFESRDMGIYWNRTCPKLQYSRLGHVNKSNPQEMMFVEANSGSFWTNDGGSTWNPGFGFCERSLSSSLPITHDCVNLKTLYKEGCNRVFKSENHGRFWTPHIIQEPYYPVYICCSNSVSGKVYTITKDPENPNISLIFVSFDAGASWQKVNLPEEDYYYIEIQDSPYNSELVFVIGICPATLREYLFRSTDGGNTFQRLDESSGYDAIVSHFHTNNLRAGSIYFHPIELDIIYAGGESSFESNDSGLTWK
ncbi:hypothetical protein K8T06_12610, partial [bacterium]|nr:hypothetical protein [bacterium]